MERLGRDPETGRAQYLLQLDRPEDLPARIDLPGGHFVCVLLWNAGGAEVAVVGALAERLLGSGCVSLCAWGDDCERVHDIFDETIVGDGTATDDHPTVMTSWHADRPLEDALFFALRCAEPDDAWAATCRAAVAVAIAQPEPQLAQVRRAFRDPSRFVDDASA